MSSSRIWFITGTSSGFGRLLTEIVLGRGDTVIATTRRLSALEDLSTQYPKEHLLILQLDVTKPSEISNAFVRAKEAFGRIDVVVNNAAFAALGEVEAVREEDARAMFETNFWGAMHVTREAIKFFREVNGPATGGRLLQVSSITGITGGPGLGFYSATKCGRFHNANPFYRMLTHESVTDNVVEALEGLTESLAAELDPSWNIKVTLIEPAGFQTGGQSKVVWGPPHPAYSNSELPATKMRNSFGQRHRSGADARKGAEAFYNIALVEDPPLHFPVGDLAILYTKKKAQMLLSDTEKYESWSADMQAHQQ